MSTNDNSQNREALLRLVNLVRPALANQSYIPAWTHVAFDGKSASCYNDISGISVACSLDLRACVPGELLVKALQSFNAEQVLVQQSKGESLIVSSGRSKLKLPMLELNAFDFEFPTDRAPEIELSDDILAGITKCKLSIGADPTQPAQMGVTLETDDKGYAVLLSTDNFSISRYQSRTKIKLPGDAPVILPTFFCEQLVVLAKAFSEAPIVLRVLAGALLVTFGTEAQLFTKTVVDVEPLDFDRILKKNVELSKIKDLVAPIPDSFDSSFGRALLVLSQEVDKVTTVSWDGKRIKLKSSSQAGDSDDVLPFDGPEGLADPVEFHIDPSLVIRASKACTHMALQPKVLVLSDEAGKFVHLIAHCSA